jgi:hypothetical protein
MQTPSDSTSTGDDSITDGGGIGTRSFLRHSASSFFTFPVLCVFMLGGFIFRFCKFQFAEPDIWWHLRNARYLVQYHSFPRVDTYSLGAAGAVWLPHEWLSEVPFYLGFRAMGLQGIFTVYFVLVFLIFAGVYYLACRAGADCKDATVVTCLAILAGGVSIGPRMLLFGWLCMVALLILLDRFRCSGKGLWLLPPLFCIWINLHGSWVFGMVALLIAVASGLVEGQWGMVEARRWSPAELKKLLAVFVASVAALFVNPFGYRLPLYPFDLFFRQSSNLQHIEEWQPVDFNLNQGRLGMIMILALFAAALFSRRRWKLSDVILAAFALWFALTRVRLLFLAGIVLPSLLAPSLRLFTPYDREIDKPWLNAAIMMALIGSLVYFFPSQASLAEQVSAGYPTAAVEFMQKEHVNGRIFNSYGWGGYMEWMAPDLKPFIDGRADIFVYNGTFDEYGEVSKLKAPFRVLDKYGIEYVLFNQDSPVSYLLDHSPAWHVIYSDKVAVLYQRGLGGTTTVKQGGTDSK